MTTKEHINLLIEARNDTIEKQNKIITQLHSDREELLQALIEARNELYNYYRYEPNAYRKDRHGKSREDYSAACCSDYDELINRIEKETEK